MNLALGIILLLAAVFLVIAVLFQQGKAHGLSGAIAGGAETFFGKDKGTRIDRLLSRLTTIFGILFVVVVLLVYIIQPDYTDTQLFVGSVWENASEILSTSINP